MKLFGARRCSQAMSLLLLDLELALHGLLQYSDGDECWLGKNLLVSAVYIKLINIKYAFYIYTFYTYHLHLKFSKIYYEERTENHENCCNFKDFCGNILWKLLLFFNIWGNNIYIFQLFTMDPFTTRETCVTNVKYTLSDFKLWLSFSSTCLAFS